jgi:hypothetical protein
VSFLILYSQRAQEVIAAMTARDRSIVIAGIRKQLAEEPLRETRNRKPMRVSPRVAALGITWELRIAGTWRVFFSVDGELASVTVIDIIRKDREMTEKILREPGEDGEP